MMKKQGKSLRILSIFLSLVMVLCLTVLVGCGNDTKDYAVDIFDSGAYEKLEYGRFLKADEDIPNDYFIYIYDFSSLKDTLNVEVCSDDEDCDFLAKRNDYVKQYLDMAIEAGYKVYIMDASDLEENINVNKVLAHFKVSNLSTLTERQIQILYEYWDMFKGGA